MKKQTHFITEFTTSAGSTFFHEGGKTNYRAIPSQKIPRSNVLKIMTRNPHARHIEEWPDEGCALSASAEPALFLLPDPEVLKELQERIYRDAMNH